MSNVDCGVHLPCSGSAVSEWPIIPTPAICPADRAESEDKLPNCGRRTPAHAVHARAVTSWSAKVQCMSVFLLALLLARILCVCGPTCRSFQ